MANVTYGADMRAFWWAQLLFLSRGPCALTDVDALAGWCIDVGMSPAEAVDTWAAVGGFPPLLLLEEVDRGDT